jgi:hypothetical protein
VSASVLNYEKIQLHSDLDLQKFTKVAESYFDPIDTYILKSPVDQYVKIRSEVSKSDAELTKKFQRKIIQFSLLFQSRSSPYKGIITSNTECFDKRNVKPIISNENTSIVMFNTKATKNFAYGKCDGEDQMYYSFYAIVLCKKTHVLYDVKFFARKKSELNGFKVECLK